MSHSCCPGRGPRVGFANLKRIPDRTVPPSIDRPAARAEIRLSGTMTLEGSPLPTPVVSINLSETGILVRAGRQVVRGTPVQLEFKEFKSKGEVIWTRQSEEVGNLLGIRFVSLARRDRKFVKGLVEVAGGS